MSDDATRLGHSSVLIKRFAFGCEQLGGYAWGAVDVQEVTAAVELAVAEGVTLFDTADCYGRGESERRLGRILASQRERVVLATKFGVRFRNSGTVWYDSSPGWIRQALDDSRERLGTDVVDLLQMHYWDGRTPITAVFDCLEELRTRGRIRWYGVTNYVPHGVDFAGYPGLVSGSLEFSLVERSHESAAREFSRAGLSFLAYGSLGQGVLSGKYQGGQHFGSDDRRSRPKYRNFHGARFARNVRIVEVLREHAAQLGATASQLAIAWILATVPGSVPLVGIKRAEQLRDVLGALRLSVPQATLAALDLASTEQVAEPAP